MSDNDYKNHVAIDTGNIWALARSLERELNQVSPKDEESATCLDAAMSLSYILTDTLDVFKKYVYEE